MEVTSWQNPYNYKNHIIKAWGEHGSTISPICGVEEETIDNMLVTHGLYKHSV